MQNLRSDIFHKKVTADNGAEKPKKREAALTTGESVRLDPAS